MQYCLGLSIYDNYIEYAKLSKDNANFNVMSYGIKFYSNMDLAKTIDQILAETDSKNIPISINITNEKYYYFDLFNITNKNYIKKAVETEFESFCADNHLNKNAVEGRFTYSKDINNNDKNKVIYIYESKGELEERTGLLKKSYIKSITPDAISIANVARLENDKNILIVDLKDETKVTTIVNKSIYNVDTLKQGMKEAFDTINAKENSIIKTYEVLKNTTIFTMEMAQGQTSNTNEYLQVIVPALYKIVQELVNITRNYEKINKIYLTGYATVINNIDLYFQEYFKDAKVEILKPFFVENNVNVNLKDYIEVNSAIGQALQGLGYGAQTLNFTKVSSLDNIKAFLTLDVGDTKFLKKKSKNNEKNDEHKAFSIGNINFLPKIMNLDAVLIRDVIVLMLILIIYCMASYFISKELDSNISKTNKVIDNTNYQISLAQADDKKILTKTTDYINYKTNLENTSNAIENKRSRKNQITTLLNKIVYTIPKEVVITEIKNTEVSSSGEIVEHISISAESKKYEQLAYFKAKLKNANVLDNIVSTEGTKEDSKVSTIIEGDLKNY